MRSTELRSRGFRPLGALVSVLAISVALPLSLIAQQSAIPAPPAPPPPPPLAPGRPDLPALPSPPRTPSVQPAFVVLLDPAHGGADTGARLGTHGVEKDLTLAFTIRLRSTLAAHGIPVAITRETDVNMPWSERAGVANHAQAAACLAIHATASGSGVHLFTSSLAPGTTPPNQMLPWQTAQAAWVTRSLRLSSEINTALGQIGIPTTLGSTSLQPLDQLACPTVAVEIAPLLGSSASKAAPISDSSYQQRLLDALSTALLEWSTDWKQQP